VNLLIVPLPVVRNLTSPLPAGRAVSLRVSRVTGIDRNKIELAANYYASYPEEVDDRIRFSDEAAERLRNALHGAASVA
jgi:hypothetical protein